MLVTIKEQRITNKGFYKCRILEYIWSRMELSGSSLIPPKAGWDDN